MLWSMSASGHSLGKYIYNMTHFEAFCWNFSSKNGRSVVVVEIRTYLKPVNRLLFEGTLIHTR